MVKFFHSVCAVIALAAAWVGPARAEIIYGITGNSTSETANGLVRFDSATPGTAISIGNLTGTTAGESVRGIHFNPANGQLYAVSNNAVYSAATNSFTGGAAATLYTVNLNTAALTTVGTFSFAAGFVGSHVSMAFNPVTNGLRVVGWDDNVGTTANLRINPATGAIVATDTTPAYRAGDPNAGGTDPAQLAAIAYSNNTAGASSTTLYTWDWLTDSFARMGSIGGSPDSPNSGILDTILQPPNFLTFNPAVGLDISGATGTAYVSHDDPSNGLTFYLDSINLTTGVRTNLGTFGSGFNVLDISVQPTAVPEPTSLALLGLGSIGVAARAWRRRKRLATN